MENQAATQTQEQPKEVTLWARAKAAVLDTTTGEVTLNEKVDATYVVQDLIKEIQALQQHIQKVEKELSDLKPKEVGDI